jgi:hypothetical protein
MMARRNIAMDFCFPALALFRQRRSSWRVNSGRANTGRPRGCRAPRIAASFPLCGRVNTTGADPREGLSMFKKIKEVMGVASHRQLEHQTAMSLKKWILPCRGNRQGAVRENRIKDEGKSLDVIENKRTKKVTIGPSIDAIENKPVICFQPDFL